MSAASNSAGSPDELLQLLLTSGFGRGQDGVATIYLYASGKMRSKLGDLDVFERAFGNELYAPLLGSQQIRAEPPVVIGNSARAELLVSFAGETVTYQLGMVRNQSGEQADRWSLSGLFREGVDL